MISFQTDPASYRHWRMKVDGRVAYLDLDVDPQGGLDGSYVLKLNSYDLGVDIELADAVQRLRFEHPEVGAVVIRSALDRMFCAGANIGMLATASHPLKVNFCKFTNETRLAIEDASANSGQRYLAAINGNAAGGGYELALATDYILLINDLRATVSLPEVPLLGVLPGTGGLTRLTDKRHVRRDRADVFSTLEEGIKGDRALEWGLVDELVPTSTFNQTVTEKAAAFSAQSDRPADARGVALTPLARQIDSDRLTYSSLTVEIDRSGRTATLTVRGPQAPPPADPQAALEHGSEFWPLRLARELDDALLHLRVNELEIGTILIRSEGDLPLVLAHDAFLLEGADHWFIREVLLLWARVLRRLDLTSRSIIALIEPGSSFGGFIAELTFSADRSYMLIGNRSGEEGPTALLALSDSNRFAFSMWNGLSRLETRFWGNGPGLNAALGAVGKELDAPVALDAGLVTDAFDDLDWEDALRLVIEERSAFSPDGLTGMEANLRFPGPETMETKIFGRLTAWQNWIFQRPSASGEEGALRRYGSGIRPQYDPKRV